MENKTEKQIWDEFKKNLGNCKDPAEAIRIAKKTISDALKKRGKDTKSNTGIAKIYQAVEQCRDPQDQLKILATGRDLNNNKLTGYGTKWKDEIKKAFERLLLEHEIKDYFNDLNKFFNHKIYDINQEDLENKIDKIVKAKKEMDKGIQVLYNDEKLYNSDNFQKEENNVKEQFKSKIKEIIGEPWQAKEKFLKENIQKRTLNLKNQLNIFKDFCGSIDKQLDEIQKCPYVTLIKWGDKILKLNNSYKELKNKITKNVNSNDVINVMETTFQNAIFFLGSLTIINCYSVMLK